jgi:AcrR family transcriptional regulator
VAGANVSAVNYHFGSLEGLVTATTRVVYHRLNAHRLAELQQAIDRRAPAPPAIAEILAALIGPSIRWSLDPASAYAVMVYAHRLSVMSGEPGQQSTFAADVEHLRHFIRQLRLAAPWFDETEIGFRLSCVLGVRTQMTRQRPRTQVLTGDLVNLGDAEALIGHTVAAIAPMFARPASVQAIQTPFGNRRVVATRGF